MLIKLFLFVIIELFFLQSNVQAKETIQWLISDFPPAHIIEGRHVNNGYGDQTLKLVADSIQGYNHTITTANFSRIIFELGKRNNVCSPTLLKSTEREKSMIFSIPSIVVLSNKLYVRINKEKLLSPYVTSDGKIDLGNLLANEKFLLGVAAKSLYGKNIDQILKRFSNTNQILNRFAEDHYSGLSEMLATQSRLDGFLGYPAEERFFYTKSTLKEKRFKSYFINDSPSYLLGYFGCSRSELGKKMIEKINSVLIKHRKNEITKFYQNWLTQEEIPIHTKLVNSIF